MNHEITPSRTWHGMRKIEDLCCFEMATWQPVPYPSRFNKTFGWFGCVSQDRIPQLDEDGHLYPVFPTLQQIRETMLLG